MSNIWTAFKKLFVRKNADADSRKDKDSGHNEYQKAQRKPHSYDEIDIKEKDQPGARKARPYDSIDVDNGKVSVPADSSETFCSLPTNKNPYCLPLTHLPTVSENQSNNNRDQLHYAELDFGNKEKKKGKNGKSGKSMKIIGAGSSVEYTEVQIQH